MSTNQLPCLDLDPDSDISGIGVRISFYLQVLLSGILIWVQDSSEDLAEALSSLKTLIVSNIAMLCTAFVLSFKPGAQINLNECLVVVYLLTLASECILLSLPAQRENRPLFKKRMYLLAVLQSYGSSAYTLIVFFKPSSFSCNSNVSIAIFRCIPLSGAGLRTAQAIAVIVPTIKTIILANDWYSFESLVSANYRQHFAASSVQIRRNIPAPLRNPLRSLHIERGFRAAVLCSIWAAFVANTELLLHCNNLDVKGFSQWGFGQILPMFLLVDPLIDVLSHAWEVLKDHTIV